jgi:predicted alpha/beta-hydrolase family hydrolase
MSPREVKGPEPRKVSFAVDAERTVSGLLIVPKGARALYVLAHGAGAGMAHPFLASISALLADRGIATLRYQFPYMEQGSRRPDSPKVAEAAVRAAVGEAARLAPGLPLDAGGKSFGGRMTSQAEASEHLPGVVGLAFLGFPLHPPGAPADTRGAHLAEVKVKMLFLQGTRDEFADLELLRPLVKRLGRKDTLHLIDGANHSFRVPAKSGRREADVMAELADTIASWADDLVA